MAFVPSEYSGPIDAKTVEAEKHSLLVMFGCVVAGYLFGVWYSHSGVMTSLATFTADTIEDNVEGAVEGAAKRRQARRLSRSTPAAVTRQTRGR